MEKAQFSSGIYPQVQQLIQDGLSSLNDSQFSPVLRGTGDVLLPVFSSISSSVDSSNLSCNIVLSVGGINQQISNHCCNNLENISSFSLSTFLGCKRLSEVEPAASVSDEVDKKDTTDLNNEVKSKLNKKQPKFREAKKKHSCPTCKKSFNRLAHLIIHQRIHSGDFPYQCALCGALFRQKDNINRHLQTHKALPRTNQHEKHSTEDVPSVSSMSDGRPQCLSQKRKSAEKESTFFLYPCSFCDSIFDCRNGLKVHGKLRHEDLMVYPCPSSDCPMESRNLDDVVSHIRTGHELSKFRCRLCDGSIKTLAKFYSHMEIHRLFCKKGHIPGFKRDNPGVTFGCPSCHRRYSSSRELKRHCKVMHSGRPKIQCSSCCKTFTYQTSYTYHVKTCHPDSSAEKSTSLTCPKCSKSFSRLDSLKRHLKLLHEPGSGAATVNRFTCAKEGCDKSFKNNDSLRDHMKCHEQQTTDVDQDSFVCTVCGKSYSRQRRLAAHVAQAHENSFKHRCNKCSKGFSRLDLLKRHTPKCTRPETSDIKAL